MSEQTQWRPDPKDIEALARKLWQHNNGILADPEAKVFRWHPMKTVRGKIVVPPEADLMPAWAEYHLDAYAALEMLHEQGRLLPLVSPQPDEPELPLDQGDTIAGHVDLSALSIPPKDRDAEWFEQTGLK